MTTRIWSKPFHGLHHLGAENGKVASTHWVTVQDCGAFALLRRRFPGGGFSSIDSTHPNVATAKAAGEAWLRDVATNQQGVAA